MDASTAQLDDFVAQRLKYLEFKFLGRVITEVTVRVGSRLQTVGADDVPRWQVLHYQVVADRIKGIFVPAGGERLGQSFIKLEIENFKSQRLSGSNFVQVACKARRVLGRRSNNQAD